MGASAVSASFSHRPKTRIHSVVYRTTDNLWFCNYNLPLGEVAPFVPDNSGGISLHVDLNIKLLRDAYVVSPQIYRSPTARFIAHADRAASFFVEESLSWQGVAHLAAMLGNGHR